MDVNFIKAKTKFSSLKDSLNRCEILANTHHITNVDFDDIQKLMKDKEMCSNLDNIKFHTVDNNHNIAFVEFKHKKTTMKVLIVDYSGTFYLSYVATRPPARILDTTSVFSPIKNRIKRADFILDIDYNNVPYNGDFQKFIKGIINQLLDRADLNVTMKTPIEFGNYKGTLVRTYTNNLNVGHVYSFDALFKLTDKLIYILYLLQK